MLLICTKEEKSHIVSAVTISLELDYGLWTSALGRCKKSEVKDRDVF